MKQLILLRHGEADHVQRGLTGGWTDSSLTALGREQAQVTGDYLAELLADQDFDLYSSDLRRAQETAEIIGDCLDIEPLYDGDLREFNNGDAADLTIEAAQKIQLPMTRPIADYEPVMVADFYTKVGRPLNHPLIEYRPYPGAENWSEMNARVFAVLDATEEAGPEIAVIITHTLSAVAVVHWWLGLGPDFWGSVSYDFDSSSLTYLRENMFGQRTITRLNDTRHLAAAGMEAEDTMLPGVKSGE